MAVENKEAWDPASNMRKPLIGASIRAVGRLIVAFAVLGLDAKPMVKIGL